MNNKIPNFLDKNVCKIDMKVQDGWANVGTVRWMGKMEKKDKPPNGDTGTYVCVEFPDPHRGINRFNGIYAPTGVKLCDAPEGTCEIMKPGKLIAAINDQAVVQLREKFGERVSHMTDSMLIKFCVARKFEFPKVVEMLEKHLKWVDEAKPTADVFCNPHFGEFYPVGFGDGYDKEGNILYFERPGNGGAYDPSKFVPTFGLENICAWHIASMEEGRRRIKNDPKAKRVTAIIDLTKLGDCDMSVVKYAKALGAIDQDNYPEHLSKMFIINAPGLFTGLWRMMKLFIDDRTKQKIHILGKDYMETLKIHIDEKELPDFLPGCTNSSWYSRKGCIGSEDPAKLKAEGSSALAGADIKTPKESDVPPEGQSPSASSPQAGEASPQSPGLEQEKTE